MVNLFGPIFNIGVTTLASIGCVSLRSTSCRSHYFCIGMTQTSRNLVSSRGLTCRTLFLNSIKLASLCNRNLNPIVVYLGVNFCVCMVTITTSVKSISFFATSRFYCCCSIFVIQFKIILFILARFALSIANTIKIIIALAKSYPLVVMVFAIFLRFGLCFEVESIPTISVIIRNLPISGFLIHLNLGNDFFGEFVTIHRFKPLFKRKRFFPYLFHIVEINRINFFHLNILKKFFCSQIARKNSIRILTC